MTSPYHTVAANLRDNGYHVMPVRPGYKVPGTWTGSEWGNLPGWAKFCDAQPPEFLHQKWESWPDAGVCVAHGPVIGLDLDTDRADVSEALHRAVTAPNVQRRGGKGWLGYYRPGDGLDDLTARVRWYDGDAVVVEILLHGTQSVLPPTIHPGTGLPYKWLTPDTLEDTDISDLPEFTGADLAALDREFTKIGLKRTAPRTVRAAEYDRPSPTAHDLEKPFGRSLNDRAMQPEAMDQWWPALDLPKSRQRGPGAWEAVPWWRSSGSGRAVQDRNPNLKATPRGIVDFGADRSYTPIDLIMAAKSLTTVSEVAEFLMPYIRQEVGFTSEDMLATVHDLTTVKKEDEPVEPTARSASRFEGRAKRENNPKPIKPTSQAEFRDAFPTEVPPFPVQDFENELTGLLREATLYIDEASNMRSEQGAFAAALVALGTIMGKKVEVSETGLRTNLYVIGTADSGAGKSSAMSAAVGMMTKCGVDDRLAGSDFTSGSAILKEMNQGSSIKAFTIDEFGDVIRRVLAVRAASHERDIGRILKDMYSSAAGVYRGKSFATEERRDIIEPHLCLYGVSTYEAFWESIDGRSFSDGLLARFIMIPIGATETQTPRHTRISEVEAGVTRVAQSSACGIPAAKSVRFEDGVWDQWMADRKLFQRHAERASRMRLPGAPSIIQRICENAMKIAMISAMGINPDDPVIEMADYEMGLDVAHWSAIYMIASIDKYYVENSSHRDLNRVKEFIEGRGERGCTKTELYAAHQGIFVNGMAAKSILDALEESGKIMRWADTSTGGRPKSWFVSTDSAKAFFEAKSAGG